MDTSNIPRTFWLSLSFCMVVATLGLLFIAYRASTVTIEIANAKIELSSALSQAKEIKNDLEIEDNRIASEKNQFLKEKIDSLEKSEKVSKDSVPDKQIMMKAVRAPKTQIYQRRFEELDAKIRAAQEAIKK